MYPDNKEANHILAQTLRFANKPRDAEKYYKKALTKNARLGLAVFGLAKIAKLRKNDALYKQHLAKAYRLNPNEPEIKEAYTKK